MIFCSKIGKLGWHRWFAWHPVVIEKHPNGSMTKVWLQWVLRKGEWIQSMGGAGWKYEYKW